MNDRPVFIYTSEPKRGLVWADIFARELPDVEFRIWKEGVRTDDADYLAAWMPPADLAARFPKLEVLFSVGAGVDQLDMRKIPEKVAVVRMVDPELTRSMVEYALFGVIALHRDAPIYAADKQAGRWRERPILRAAERTVGVMGLGVLGRAVAEAVRDQGFPVRGWSASPKAIDGVRTFAGVESLGEFLSGSDILICLLPLTVETRGILCASTFAAMPEGSRLLAIGRGGHIVADDLVAALDSGQIACAVLDVLPQEPPAVDDPLFRHPLVMVTPHVASFAHPASSAMQVISAIRRHRAGEPLLNRVDRLRSY
ncbi:glyoxylate/hydroxypyruvate reductase A [Terrarubrum flagellatum]|uniref:2-hydroxyacid dehydrogenase n=1 Tax=Terrirubrum flagellatum TaxID=2895980 RepID=UPI0031455634